MSRRALTPALSQRERGSRENSWQQAIHHLSLRERSNSLQRFRVRALRSAKLPLTNSAYWPEPNVRCMEMPA